MKATFSEVLQPQHCLILTVGMLAHLSRSPEAKYKDSTVKDLGMRETEREKEEGRVRKRTIRHKEQKSGRKSLAYIPGLLGGIRNRGHELGWGIRTKEGVIEEKT